LKKEIQYSYNEDKVLNEIKKHIDDTYGQHYINKKKNIQSIDYIMSISDSTDFLKGNIIKYISRFGKKEGFNKDDLFKCAHYLIMLYHFQYLDGEE